MNRTLHVNLLPLVMRPRPRGPWWTRRAGREAALGIILVVLYYLMMWFLGRILS